MEKELDATRKLDHELEDVHFEINVEKQDKIAKEMASYKDPKYENGLVGGAIIPPKTVEGLLREIARYENQLQVANEKLNKVISANGVLRVNINKLRKEKNNIDKIYRQLYKEVEEKKA